METRDRGFTKKTMGRIIEGKLNAFYTEFVKKKFESGLDDLETVKKVTNTRGIMALASLSEGDEAQNLGDEQKELIAYFIDNTVVAGGAFASMLLGEMPNDFDIYFKNKDAAKKFSKMAVRGLISDDTLVEVHESQHGVTINAKSAGVAGDEVDMSEYRYFEHRDESYSRDFFRENSGKANDKPEKLTLAMATSNALSFNKRVQVIIRFCGSGPEVVEFFDFVHTKNYWTKEEGVVLNMDSVLATNSKTLQYTGSLFPVCAMFRTRKFLKRGWNINAGQMFKIAYDISKLNLDDKEVLAEQLTGVDQAYFNEVIEEISKLKAEHDKIDGTYLFKLMDKIFEDEESL